MGRWWGFRHPARSFLDRPPHIPAPRTAAVLLLKTRTTPYCLGCAWNAAGGSLNQARLFFPCSPLGGYTEGCLPLTSLPTLGAWAICVWCNWEGFYWDRGSLKVEWNLVVSSQRWLWGYPLKKHLLEILPWNEKTSSRFAGMPSIIIFSTNHCLHSRLSPAAPDYYSYVLLLLIHCSVFAYILRNVIANFEQRHVLFTFIYVTVNLMRLW